MPSEVSAVLDAAREDNRLLLEAAQAGDWAEAPARPARAGAGGSPGRGAGNRGRLTTYTQAACEGGDFQNCWKASGRF